LTGFVHVTPKVPVLDPELLPLLEPELLPLPDPEPLPLLEPELLPLLEPELLDPEPLPLDPPPELEPPGPVNSGLGEEQPAATARASIEVPARPRRKIVFMACP
jgi:hypothetical protein